MSGTPNNADAGRSESLLRARRPRLAVGGAIILVAMAAGIPAITTTTFTAEADSILRLPLVSHVKHIPKIFGAHFTAFTDGRYQPFAYALLALGRTFVSADNAVFWNLWLFAFCVLNALLVYAVARHFAKRDLSAVVALGVFLLHPVASAFGHRLNLFPDVLSGGLYLGTLLCYLRFVRTGRAWPCVLGIVLFACGLLTAHDLLTLPVLLLLYEVFHERTRPLKVLARVGPMLVMAAAAIWLFASVHPHRAFYIYPSRACAGEAWHWAYSFAGGGVDHFTALARGFAVPAPVSQLVGGMHEPWSGWFLSWAILIGLVLVVAVAAMLRRQWFAVGLFLLFAAAAPRFSTPQSLTGDYAAWNHGVLPVLGFALLSAAVVDALLAIRSRLWLGLVATAAGVSIVACAALLVVANVQLTNPERYWRDVLRQDPNSEIASIKLGSAILAEAEKAVDRGDEVLAGEKRAQALGYLFGPATTRIRPSCLVMACHYSRCGEQLAAIVHLGIAQRQTRSGLLYTDDTLSRAIVLYRARALDFAEQFLGDALAADPCNVTALEYLAEILATKGYVPAAVRCLRAAVDIDPGNSTNRQRLEELERRLYHPEGREPVRIASLDGEWLRYAIDQGRPERIRRQVLELARTHRADPGIQLAVGIILGESRRYREALQKIDGVIAAMPRFSFARVAKCWVSAAAVVDSGTDPGMRDFYVGQFEQTAAGVDRLALRDAESWRRLGHTRGKANQHRLSIAAYKAALVANPHLVEAYGNIGAQLVRLDRNDEAIEWLNKALEMKTDEPDGVHGNLGCAMMCLRRDGEALEHFRKALDVNPEMPAAYRYMAKIHRRRNDLAGCIRVLSEGLEANADDLGLKTDLAMYLATVSDDDLWDCPRAVRLAEEVCRRDDVTPEQLDVLAMAYAGLGRFDEAVITAGQAVTRARKLAEAAARRGDRDGASRYLSTAGEIDSRRKLYRQRKTIRIGPRRLPSALPER